MIPPEEVLDVLRTQAKLDGDDKALRKAGADYRKEIQNTLYKDLDEKISEAWDALEVLGEHSGWRQDCVILECCSGSAPYVKGYLMAQKIPAFELRPPIPKKPTLSSLVVTKAFSEVVSDLPGKWGYAHPSTLHPDVPLAFYLMSRTDVTFTPNKAE